MITNVIYSLHLLGCNKAAIQSTPLPTIDLNPSDKQITAQKDYVYQLTKLVKAFNFLSSFYKYSQQIEQFVFFAGAIGSQLIKEGSESVLMMDISKLLLSKAAVNFLDSIGFILQDIKKYLDFGSALFLRYFEIYNFYKFNSSDSFCNWLI